jgi:phosphoribosylformylglycinamidine synthase
MGDTIFCSEKSDAAVIRIHGTKKAVAITCDCNPIYCKSNPKIGAEIAVAESWRNLIAAGATPIAITDNLNFGNPEKKEIMYEIKQAIQGIKNACEKLSYPVVSGNVSLYNETNKDSIMPTPVIGGVGLIEKLENAKGFKMKENANIFLVGRTIGHLELSLFYQMNNLNEGKPPKVDFKKEIKNGEFVKKLITQKNGVIGCHDISEGGIGLSLAELCISNNMGVKIKIPKKFISNPEKWIFGEDQSRYILIVEENFDIRKHNNKEVEIERLGVVKGASLEFTNCFEIPVKNLIKLNNKWFDEYLK